ncbi:MAG: polyhydroxyalkanoate synthesis regulator DNA-binding domain-containing protein [Proteobacteria bacterium]|nr:polyhydroxyalkanoate synthesis regulator DNA-binding domain-containing protein [Pseudomonadota bacterium]MBU1583360.1 polyhydroxyalkanoate synthesis regulator DNA-binding domain-containing protein [Pseudomonadota bacterium]MBU2453144.1 polyhydroxyalkanoate synthesis regulator DNA-binding domain-containing protein [Pseudomonadota bacterium]MBU2627840.1 polyhydroxyalkanoate synthesis regulator DNA-binding domain-containing protein [Pseudomonadota bacterium]
MPEKVKFKKYANRRLYNMEKSKYVTLKHVAELIRKGRQVEVIDVQTEEDVTAFILTQIIMEESKNNNNLLPIPLLHLSIQYGETILREFFEKYLQQTLEAYLSHKIAVDEHFGKMLELGMGFSNLAQKSMYDMFAEYTKNLKK